MVTWYVQSSQIDKLWATHLPIHASNGSGCLLRRCVCHKTKPPRSSGFSVHYYPSWRITPHYFHATWEKLCISLKENKCIKKKDVCLQWLGHSLQKHPWGCAHLCHTRFLQVWQMSKHNIAEKWFCTIIWTILWQSNPKVPNHSGKLKEKWISSVEWRTRDLLWRAWRRTCIEPPGRATSWHPWTAWQDCQPSAGRPSPKLPCKSYKLGAVKSKYHWNLVRGADPV